MPKRRPKKVVRSTSVASSLRKALAKRTKGELVDVLLELAQDDRGVLRRLTRDMKLEISSNDLAAATRRAIGDATDFDEREINQNFDYDYDAYREVRRNLERLVASGELRLAMDLSLELMEQGSGQVEMSDEGLMTDDIEECLLEVIGPLKKSDLSPQEVAAWCDQMSERDRVGFICDKELAALREFVATPQPKQRSKDAPRRKRRGP